MEADFKKNVNDVIEAKERLFTESAYLVLNKDDFLLDAKAILSYDKNSFKARIISSKHPSSGQNDDPYECLNGSLELHKNGKQYSISTEEINGMTYSLSDPCVVTYDCRAIVINSKILEKPLKHTLLVEIEDMPTFQAFELKKVKIGSIIHFRFFSTNINKVEYHCYCHENKEIKKVYLFIESMNEVLIEEFKESAKTIRYLIAIFNGDWYRGDLYIHSEDLSLADHNKYVSGQYYYDRESIITGYNICDTLKCSQYLELVKQSQHKNILCSRAPTKNISEICAGIHLNHKVQRVIELILEATKNKSVVLQTSVYAIALETLANIILSKSKSTLNPIPDERLMELIIDKFNGILSEYDSFITDQSKSIIEKRIQNINKPANVDRISKSFEELGIELNSHDQKTLKIRNKYLHGSTPIKEFESDKSKERELRLLSVKFRMLLIMQLTKFLGYKGHIWNHYGEIKAYDNKSITEHLIRFV